MRIDRLNELEQYIITNGTVSMDELVQHFNVSINTIRRDIAELLKRDHIKKVYGGVAMNAVPLVPYSAREQSNNTAKETIGRWENEGVREIWEFRLEKGLTLDFAQPFDSSPLYAVMEGSVEASLFDGLDVYTAQTRDFLHIPAYTPHSLTMLEDTVLLAYNVHSELLCALEALQAGFTCQPERRSQWPWITNTLQSYDCWLTGVRYAGQGGGQ